MSWFQDPIASFDLETTGVDPHEARIVTACVLVEGYAPREWLVDPGVEIPEAAAAIHGVTTDQARAFGRPAVESVAQIRDELHRVWACDQPVVIFNAPYDLTLLACELERHGQGPLVVGPVLDPLVIWREAERYRKGKKRLGDAAERFGVAAGAAHTSTGDAQTALEVLRVMAGLWNLGEMSLLSLAQDQARWHREWATSFGKWLSDRGGDASGVDLRWPLSA